MAAVAITGTITDATGAGVQDVLVRLEPQPRSAGAAEAVEGVAILDNPVSVRTDVNGDFSVNAVQGFSYRLTIPAAQFDRAFVAPAVASVRFDLLGLAPTLEQAADYVDDSGVTHVSVTVSAASIETVLARFDSVQVERSTTGRDGPYSLLDTVDLESGETFYEVDDATGASTYYYRARYWNTSNSDASQYSDPQLGDSASEALLLTVDELKSTYLFGVSLVDGAGVPFPERMFERYIEAAVGWLEKELDIPLVATDVVDETHDHYGKDYGAWGYFQLWRYPVIRVDQVAFQYPTMPTPVVIDEDWVQLVEGGASGVLQIVPGQGNIADVLLIPGALMPLWSGATGRVPAIWKFSYRAGFEIGALPADLKHAIAMQAAIGILNIAGDLIAGAGIATKSISVPGLSQSIGTTSSATNSGYGARIGEYQKELKEMLPNLRRYYGKTTRMVVA